MYLLTNFLLTLGMIVTAIIIFLLFKNEGRNISRKILGFIFLTLLFVIIYSYGEFNDVYWMLWVGFPIADSLGFIIGPLLYFYIISLFQEQKLSLNKVCLHFLPAIIYLISISIPFLLSFIQDDYLFDYLHFLDKNEYLLHLQALYLMIYALISLNKLNRYKKLAKQHFSNLKKIDLNWVTFLLWSIVFLMVFDIAIEIYAHSTEHIVFESNQTLTIAMVIIVVYLGYFGTNQSRILLPSFMIENTPQTSKNEPNHHLANATDKEIEELQSRLYNILKDKKPYKNEQLNLVMLAEMIPTSDRKLSALLNHKLNTTFYDLINSHRIEAVKEKMANPEFDKFTLLALAYDAGFNSKTSFNRIFKKSTGISPSEYKKNLKTSK